MKSGGAGCLGGLTTGGVAVATCRVSFLSSVIVYLLPPLPLPPLLSCRDDRNDVSMLPSLTWKPKQNEKKNGNETKKVEKRKPVGVE